MTKSRPLLIVVITLCMLFAALTAFWIALLPQRMLGQISELMLREQGLTLEAKKPRLRFDGDLVLRLEAVTLTDGKDNVTALTARDMTLDVGIASLFGGGVTAKTLTLNAPIVNIEVSGHATTLSLPARRVILREGVVKLRDATRKSVVALADVNGQISMGESAKLDVSFILNGAVTTLAAEVESATRLLAEGSPADISLSAKNQIISFSGRARYSSGVELDGQITLEGSDAAGFFNWIGMPLRLLEDVGPIALTSGVSTNGLSATLNNVDAKTGAQNVKGNANVQAGPDRMKLTADLAMAGLNVLSKTSLLAAPWSEKPFDLSDLTAVDADVKFKVEHLSLRGLDQGPSDVAVTSTDGKTNIDVSLAATKFHVALVPKSKMIQLDATLDAKLVDAKTLLAGLLGFDRLSGPVNLLAKVSAEGANPAALISTLKGNINLDGQKLSLSGIDLRSLIATPHEGWQANDTAKTARFDMSFESQIDDGVAALQKAEIALPDATLKAKGEIDFLRQAFSVSFAPKGKVQSLKGTWVRPLFAADAGIAPALRPVTAPAN